MSVLDAFSLSGKVSVVTGANRGIGRALAPALAEAGSDVVLLVRDREGAAAAVPSSRPSGSRALASRPTSPTPRAGAAGRRPRSWTGWARSTSWSTTPEPASTGRRWRSPRRSGGLVMDVNVDGVWNCAQAFGRQMVAQRSGVIVNIGSISAQIVNRPQWQPGVQRLQGRGAPADQVPGCGVGAVRRPGQRARPRLHQDRDGAGGRASVPSALDRGRADAPVRHARPSWARAWCSSPPTPPAS